MKILVAIAVAVLAAAPLGWSWLLGPPTGINVPTSLSELDFLAIAIALAAYVSAVRIALISRLGSGAQAPLLSKIVVLSLIPADFNLIVCGLAMAARLFFPHAFGNQWIDPLMPVVIFLFAFAVAYLALQHLAAWVLSYLKFFDVF